jgi:hypothetical protein
LSVSLITSSFSHPNPAFQQESLQSSSQQQPAQLPLAGAQGTVDTVQISQIAQIQLMALRGDSAPTIAVITGLTVGTVDSDLGISTSSSSVPLATPNGPGGGPPAFAAAGFSDAATLAPTLSVLA